MTITEAHETAKRQLVGQRVLMTREAYRRVFDARVSTLLAQPTKWREGRDLDNTGHKPDCECSWCRLPAEYQADVVIEGERS